MDLCLRPEACGAGFFRALRGLWAARAGEAHSPAGRLGAQDAARQAEEALQDYGNSIFRLAYAYLHNPSDAEEILQDTLVQLLRTAPRFQSPAHEKAWLMRVAANLSKNRLSYNQIRRADPLSEELSAQSCGDLSFVWEAVKALPVNRREVIHLYYQEGYSTGEIAKILRRKESTIRSDLRRGREELKAVLKEVYDFDGTVSPDYGPHSGG